MEKGQNLAALRVPRPRRVAVGAVRGYPRIARRERPGTWPAPVLHWPAPSRLRARASLARQPLLDPCWGKQPLPHCAARQGSFARAAIR